MSLHSNETVTKIKADIRDKSHVGIGLTILLFRGIWKVLELQTRKVVECCKSEFNGLS